VSRFEEAYRGCPPRDVGRPRPAAERRAGGDRPPSAASPAAFLRAGGAPSLACSREAERSEGGPPRATLPDIRAALARPFRVAWIRADRFESRVHAHGARAWLARIAGEPGPP
jgi:hypothetical protein